MKLKIALIAAALAFTGTAFAQEKKNSLSLFGNISGSSGSDPSSTIAVSVGRLFGDSLELEGSLIHAGTPTSDSNIAGVGLKYYLRPVGKGGSVLPYLKAGVQFTSTSVDRTCVSSTGATFACGTTDSNDTTATLGGGMDFAVSESVFPFVEVTASKSSKSNSSGTNYLVQLGVRVRY